MTEYQRDDNQVVNYTKYYIVTTGSGRALFTIPEEARSHYDTVSQHFPGITLGKSIEELDEDYNPRPGKEETIEKTFAQNAEERFG